MKKIYIKIIGEGSRGVLIFSVGVVEKIVWSHS